jgi:hypothetical protein
MSDPPTLPTGFELRDEVNGWEHNPEATYNAYVWESSNGESSVAVFESIADYYFVKVIDERITGPGKYKIIHETPEADNRRNPDESARTPPEIENAVEAAVTWMQNNDPPFRHPDVVEAAFEPPAGFSVESYNLGHREHEIFYAQDTDQTANDMAGRPVDTDASLSTRKFLAVDVYRGSGDATVSLSLYTRGHDHEKTAVIDDLDRAGVETAVERAREWVANHREKQDAPSVVEGSNAGDTGDSDDAATTPADQSTQAPGDDQHALAEF